MCNVNRHTFSMAIFSTFMSIAFALASTAVEIHSVDICEFQVNYVYYVTMNASGEDAGPVSDVDFAVYEDGTEQRMITEEEERFPASLVLILDSSGSMKQAMADVLAAAQDLVGRIDEYDYTEVIDFDSDVKVIQKSTNNKQALSDALNSITADGGTALYDAIARGLTDVEKREGLKAIVLLTDGKDENAQGDGPGSAITLDKLKTLLRNAAIPLYTIGLGKGVERVTLNDIASTSGGKAYYAQETDAVGKIYSDIITYLHSLRRFYYVTHNGKHDGTHRKVLVKAKAQPGTPKAEALYTAPQKKSWSYAFTPNKEWPIHHLAMSPDGQYIAALNIASILSKEGLRRHVRWDGTDAYGGICTGQYVQDRGWLHFGSLYKFDGKDLTEIESNTFLMSASGDFHREWEWYPKAISKGAHYIVFATRTEEEPRKFFFVLYDIAGKNVLWEKHLYSGEFDEPGAIVVADNGTSLITQDCNLFAIAKDGAIMYSWMWENTGKRFKCLAITADGTRYLARLDADEVQVYDINGTLLWKVASKAEERGGGIDCSANGKYFAVNDQYGPRIFDAAGKILFQDLTKNPAPSEHSENGIAVADDGSYVFARENRIYYGKIE
jgi:VWFA-related protein